MDPLSDHDKQAAIIHAMRRPAFYPHKTDPEIRVVQTHLSYVLLTGPFAYKIGKAVQLGFVDFSTLEKRRRACAEEVRLNRLYAPALYLGVVDIREHAEEFSLDGEDGEVVECAVKMRQFRDEDLLLRVFERGELASDDVDCIARHVARFHRDADSSAAIAKFGEREAVRSMVAENFEALEAHGDALWRESELDELRRYTDAVLNDHADVLEQRVREQRIRECHGDLHLGNICYFDGSIAFFDRIAFNDAFKNIDVFYDLAFLFMDFEYRGRRDLAMEFLNKYLEETNDFHGLPLLKFYACCRAMIRCKVMALEASEVEVDEETRVAAKQEAKGYFRLAARYAAASSRGVVVMMCGLSGSGKSLIANHLATRMGAVVVRSDAVRKHLAGHGPREHPRGIYTRELTRGTYAFLIDQALRISACGFPVVLDATFSERDQRGLALDALEAAGIRKRIVRCHADTNTLRRRLEAREGDVSDADLEVLAKQMSSFEDLDDRERAFAVELDTDVPVNYEALVRELMQA